LRYGALTGAVAAFDRKKAAPAGFYFVMHMPCDAKRFSQTGDFINASSAERSTSAEE
jgi:hypothetical protein